MNDERFLIVGTAGHIDHGKTALVKALTGKNTDRLKEEQERGISIDIDFAPLYCPDGTLIGMVDVPGHERFVRNMVAGAAGIDAALLVIDAGEGMKPQTYEHIAVVEMLGVQRGIVALTKVDLLDAEWLDVSREVIREELQGTVFATAPVIETSAKTGFGVDNLRTALQTLAQEVPVRDRQGAFRQPVDKVFSIPGFGTVVSGSVWRGRIQVGDVVDCLPQRTQVRVRGIQVHGKAVDTAIAGQRAALNITGLDRAQVGRGHALAAPGTLFESKLVDAEVRLLPRAGRPLLHRERIHFHLGTAEVVGRVLLLESDELQPGASAFAQILLEKPVVCEANDRFVIRSFSPVSTLGGGFVLDATPTRLHRRKRVETLSRLAARSTGSPLQRLVAAAEQGQAVTATRAMAELGVTDSEALTQLQQGVTAGQLYALPSGWYATSVVEQALQSLGATLASLHHKNRFLSLVPKSEVVSAGAGRFPPRDAQWLLQEGERRQLWQMHHSGMHSSDWKVRLEAAEAQMLEQILRGLQTAGMAGGNLQELMAMFPKRDRIAAGLLKYAEESGFVIQAEPDWFLAAEVFAAAVAKIQELYLAGGPFTLAQVRDLLQTSRKSAVALLEYADKIGLTKRVGDTRVVQEKFPLSQILKPNVTELKYEGCKMNLHHI